MFALIIALVALLTLAIMISGQFAVWTKEDSQYDESTLRHAN